jgi:hypothetical protein
MIALFGDSQKPGEKREQRKKAQDTLDNAFSRCYYSDIVVNTSTHTL